MRKTWKQSPFENQRLIALYAGLLADSKGTLEIRRGNRAAAQKPRDRSREYRTERLASKPFDTRFCNFPSRPTATRDFVEKRIEIVHRVPDRSRRSQRNTDQLRPTIDWHLLVFPWNSPFKSYYFSVDPCVIVFIEVWFLVFERLSNLNSEFRWLEQSSDFYWYRWNCIWKWIWKLLLFSVVVW